MGELKTCTNCNQPKNIDEFYKDSKSKDGHHSYCKNCQREYLREWQKENRDKNRMYSLNWYYRNKESRMEYQRKYREDRVKLHVHSYTHHYPERYPLASSCEGCGSTNVLERHHPNYNNIENYITYCRSCHWRVHHD